MYQIDNSTAAQAIPASTAAGNKGYFTDGNPATGTPATILPAEFMNMLMMENINVLAAAGIQPDKSKFNQLALAISTITGSNLTWANLGGKPTTSAGFGITDVYTKTQMDAFLLGKANSANTIAGYNITDAYTKQQTDAALSGKADKATTLAGYKIVDGMVIGTGGIGATSSPQAINVNTLPYGGLWSVNPGTVGAPFANGSVLHNAYDVASGNWTQILADMGGSSVYWRGSLNYSISNFKKFWDSENFNPALKVTGDSCPTAGFYGGSKVRPYMQYADATVVELPTLAQLIATNAAVAQRITAINCSQAGFVDGTTNTPFMTHSNGTTVGLARADSVVGVGQSWQDVTGGRAASTIYTNTTSKPIMVSVYSGNDLRNELRLSVGGVEVSKFALASSAGAQSIASVTAIVPPGATYIVSIGSGAISKWAELR